MTGQSFTRLVKFILIIIDVLIFLSGIIMLIGGSVVQSQINSEKLAASVGGYSTQAGSIICIIFGLFVTVFSLFGLYSAVKDHHRFLIVYCSFMSIIFIIQFITGIVGLSVKNGDNFVGDVAEIVRPMFQYGHTQSLTNFYQSRYQCCGWNDYRDYLANATDVNSLSAPSSCCQKSGCDTAIEANLYPNGCQNKLVSMFSKVIEGACGILVTMSLITAASLILSGILIRQIKSGYQYT